MRWVKALRYGFLAPVDGSRREVYIQYWYAPFRERLGHDLKVGEAVEFGGGGNSGEGLHAREVRFPDLTTKNAKKKGTEHVIRNTKPGVVCIARCGEGEKP